MQHIRCGSCNALLFKAGQGAIANDIQIKCRRCGTLNHLRPFEPLNHRQEREDQEHTNDLTDKSQRTKSV
ncbi:Com family DNA-binding transcriptional regulator [Labrenzia sp. CE80]|uniref:Com family DNA-binding transcriptional regulator n=1 Tax=Labrenzia sp. CE80 TaxID=1788986 RepID=UPI00129B4848